MEGSGDGWLVSGHSVLYRWYCRSRDPLGHVDCGHVPLTGEYMAIIKIDSIDYNIPQVVMDILVATADERDKVIQENSKLKKTIANYIHNSWMVTL